MALGSQGELREALYGLLGGHSAASKAFIDAFSQIQYKADKVLDGDASTASTYCLDNDTDARFRVDSAVFVPHAALTADDANYGTIALVYNDGAGGADTTVATLSTTITGGTGNWTAFVGEALTITAANAVVATGKQLAVKFTKTGTGVAIPAGSLIVKGTRV